MTGPDSAVTVSSSGTSDAPDRPCAAATGHLRAPTAGLEQVTSEHPGHSSAGRWAACPPRALRVPVRTDSNGLQWCLPSPASWVAAHGTAGQTVKITQAPSLPKLRARVRFSSPALLQAPGQRPGACFIGVSLLRFASAPALRDGARRGHARLARASPSRRSMALTFTFTQTSRRRALSPLFPGDGGRPSCTCFVVGGTQTPCENGYLTAEGPASEGKVVGEHPERLIALRPVIPRHLHAALLAHACFPTRCAPGRG